MTTENQGPDGAIRAHLPCRVDREILRQVGPIPAVVHVILVANNNGDGSRLTAREATKATGIAHITVQRSIDEMHDSGLLKSEPDDRDGTWQLTDRYTSAEAGA